ncbi:hypothetical protein [Microtetraspora malaysiensis]|uniref:hypothetical protein n=1 Tax=Microtetraspora malaysiensis TaxID=161358 RepID=UPI003D944C7B
MAPAQLWKDLVAVGPFSVVRWVRAVSFAATCTTLAALGHLAGGGSFDPAAAFGGLFLLLPPALALTGRERSFGAILPATGLSQVVLHVLLSQSAGHHEMAPFMADMARTGQMHHANSFGMGMLLMHLASVVVTSAWLRWVEEGLCALARQLAGRMLRPLLILLSLSAEPGCGRPPAVVPARDDETVRVRVFLRHALVRRGPPGERAASAATF